MLISKPKPFFIKLILTILISISITTTIHAEGNLNFFNGQNPHENKFGKFVLTGKMKYPRYGHQAVVLQDGRVLIEGGSGEPFKILPAEIYDPMTGKFSEASTCTWSTGIAILVNSGKVFFSSYQGAYTYDPTKNIFEELNGLPIKIGNRFVRLLDDGRVFIDQSKTISSEKEYQETQKQENNQFTYKAIPMQYEDRKWTNYYLSVGFIYDPTANKVIRLTDEERNAITANIVEYSERYKYWTDWTVRKKQPYGVIFNINKYNHLCIGGEDDPVGIKFKIYNYQDDKIITLNQTMYPHSGGYDLSKINNKYILLSGGASGEILKRDYYSETEILDIKQRKFVKGPDLQFQRAAHMGIELKDGRILITGGVKNKKNELAGYAELFIPATQNVKGKAK